MADYGGMIKDFLLSPSPQVRVIKFLYGEYKRGATLEDNTFSEWLYGEWDETKYKQYLALNAVPGISQYMDYLLSYRGAVEYLNRYGMDWSDIHDPRKLGLSNSGTALARFGLNFVSRNVTKLYR